MRKIIELDIILPYYEAMYKVGKEIKKTDINCSGNDYLITTETGKEIWIFEGQPGLQVIWENKNN